MSKPSQNFEEIAIRAQIEGVRLLQENRRLRSALEDVISTAETFAKEFHTEESAVIGRARKALAGEA